MYLVSSSPANDTLALLFTYERQLEELRSQNWALKVKQTKMAQTAGMLQTMARMKGMSETEFVALQAREMLAQAEADLKRKFTPALFVDEAEDEDPREAALKRHEALAEKMSQGAEYAERYKDLLASYPKSSANIPEWGQQFLHLNPEQKHVE